MSIKKNLKHLKCVAVEKLLNFIHSKHAQSWTNTFARLSTHLAAYTSLNICESSANSSPIEFKILMNCFDDVEYQEAVFFEVVYPNNLKINKCFTPLAAYFTLSLAHSPSITTHSLSVWSTWAEHSWILSPKRSRKEKKKNEIHKQLSVK